MSLVTWDLVRVLRATRVPPSLPVQVYVLPPHEHLHVRRPASYWVANNGGVYHRARGNRCVQPRRWLESTAHVRAGEHPGLRRRHDTGAAVHKERPCGSSREEIVTSLTWCQRPLTLGPIPSPSTAIACPRTHRACPITDVSNSSHVKRMCGAAPWGPEGRSRVRDRSCCSKAHRRRRALATHQTRR
jgi:hypothetical protein